MTLSVAVLQPGPAPHLPPLRGDDHDAALPRLLRCLTEEYGADPLPLESRHASTPHLLEKRLALLCGRGGRADRGGQAPELLVLFIRAHVTVFKRGRTRFCALSLRDSVPGRPSSMLETGTLVALLARLLPSSHLLVLADLDLLPSSSRQANAAVAEGPAEAKDCSRLVARALRDVAGHALSCAVSVRLACTPETGAAADVPRRPSLFRACDSALRAAADAGSPVPLSDLVSFLGSYLGTGDSLAYCADSPSPFRLVPLNHEQRLPAHVRDDLYSPDPGSRLDAATELAQLEREGNPWAQDRLEELNRYDPSADVRGFALGLLCRDERPGIERMHAFGFLSTAQLHRAPWPSPLPDLTEPFDGTGIVGIDAPDGQPFERPAHKVRLAPFRMALRPVTNRDFLHYVTATGAPCPEHWNSGWVFADDLDHPVVMVSWYEARAYCRWLTEEARGRRFIDSDTCLALPSEAEWEIAARNAAADTHPWGRQFEEARCNVRVTGVGRVLRVGAFSPGGDSRAGCVDLVGNVWEWTSSAWGRSGRHPDFTYPYDPDDGRENPDHGAEVRRVVRGGGYYYAEICANGYTRNRMSPHDRHPGGGFRVVARRER